MSNKKSTKPVDDVNSSGIPLESGVTLKFTIDEFKRFVGLIHNLKYIDAKPILDAILKAQ